MLFVAMQLCVMSKLKRFSKTKISLSVKIKGFAAPTNVKDERKGVGNASQRDAFHVWFCVLSSVCEVFKDPLLFPQEDYI